jgi:outer membrane protein OmpA-like peptidoglycan-associated protein
MKKILLLIILICTTELLQAQETVGGKVVKNTKDKTYQKGEQKADETVDKALNKVEDGIKNIFKKKDKKKKKKDEQVEENSQEMEQNESSSKNSNPSKNSSSKSKNVKSNSKFDFEPGNKVLYFDNFERLNIGDFPAEFNTNASGEVVNVSEKPGKWLSMTQNGAFIPESIKELPDNFTLEFEVGLIGQPGNNYSGLALNFTTEKDQLFKDVLFGWSSSILYLHPGADLASIQILPSSGENEVNNEIPMPQWSQNGERFAKISIWRQKGRLRLYVNENKLIDSPRFFAENKPYNLAFSRRLFEDNCEILMTNIRYAIAGEDTRSKLITEGKLVTNGILFDVNSDNIKPESGSVLKEIATTLQENPTVRVKIIGHTDSDGADTANLALSKKRAVAVKTALSSFYGIDVSRLETDGKGESVPLNKNANASEKAQNRRVEFIKL